MSLEYSIEILREIDVKNLQEIIVLLDQLDPTISSPSMELLNKVADSSNTNFFVAKSLENSVIGILLMMWYLTPEGKKAWIEDVVVEEKWRGKGVGKELVGKALAKAREIGVKTVNLTSRPSRKDANLFYQRMGFKLRETNCYSYEVK